MPILASTLEGLREKCNGGITFDRVQTIKVYIGYMQKGILLSVPQNNLIMASE